MTPGLIAGLIVVLFGGRLAIRAWWRWHRLQWPTREEEQEYYEHAMRARMPADQRAKWRPKEQLKRRVDGADD